MGKRRSGPEGPDCTPEPFETETSDAALEQIEDTSDCGCSQDCLHQLFADYPDSFVHVDLGNVVMDSGWEYMPRLAVRVVLSGGPPNPDLRSWVRRLAMKEGASGDA